MKNTPNVQYNVRLADVPNAAAYLVYHDCMDNGAMEVWLYNSLEAAQEYARYTNQRMCEMGEDEYGLFKVYEKLPHKKVWKLNMRMRGISVTTP